jgi:lactoylglutathione lyase
MSTKYVFASIVVLAQCLVFEQPLCSQATKSEQRPEFDHITLHVRDLEQSAQFYRGIIGLEQVADPFKDGKHLFFRLSAHTQLHLIPGAKGGTQHDDEGHFALRVLSVESFCTMLQQKHIKYFGSDDKEGVVTTRPDGIKQIYFQDPDGYWVEVNDSRL